MFYNILDKKRLAILPLLKNFKAEFYLAGGTGLALQIGHRDSVDFDFFSPHSFDTSELFRKVKEVFAGHKLQKVQEENNTLTVIVGGAVKLSFFTYQYKLLKKPLATENLKLASILDIACMKLSAIVSRATTKDYIDLYFILQQEPLTMLIKAMRRKMPELDPNLALKSLTYFQDIQREPIRFRNNHNIAFSQVKDFLVREVRNL